VRVETAMSYLVGVRVGVVLTLAVASIATLLIVLDVRTYIARNDAIARAAIFDVSTVKATVDSIDTRLRRVERMIVIDYGEAGD
jgi:hypothetical protein